MELVHGTCKASKSAQEENDNDVISRMPDNVITNILDCLPIQDAVKTGILSRNWRFKWNRLSQLEFDMSFFVHLASKRCEKYYGRIISRLLLHVKGAITKFYLYIDEKCDSILDGEDINNWILILSTRGIEDLTISNFRQTPLKLHTHLFSCLKLKHLDLFNFYLPPMPSFRGFPNLLSLDLVDVPFETYKFGELLTWCPFLEILKVGFNTRCETKRIHLVKLDYLKVLSLSLCDLDTRSMITSSGILQLMGLFPKLQELNLRFSDCKLLADAEKKVLTRLPCLTSLELESMDISSATGLSSAIEFICGSPNLQKLTIMATCEDDVPPPAVGSSEVEVEVDCSRMGGQLQLREVWLLGMRGLANEVCLIKSLLASSPLLKQMVISPRSSKVSGGDHREMMFAKQLLKLQRASPIAEIELLVL